MEKNIIEILKIVNELKQTNIYMEIGKSFILPLLTLILGYFIASVNRRHEYRNNILKDKADKFQLLIDDCLSFYDSINFPIYHDSNLMNDFSNYKEKIIDEYIEQLTNLDSIIRNSSFGNQRTEVAFRFIVKTKRQDKLIDLYAKIQHLLTNYIIFYSNFLDKIKSISSDSDIDNIENMVNELKNNSKVKLTVINLTFNRKQQFNEWKKSLFLVYQIYKNEDEFYRIYNEFHINIGKLIKFLRSEMHHV